MRAADPSAEPLPAAPCQAIGEALDAAAAAAKALPEGSIKSDRLKTLAMLRDLAALLETGDKVLLKALELLGLEETSRRDSHAGR